MVPAINIILYTYDFAKSRSSVKCSYHKYTNKQKGHEEAFEGMGVFMAYAVVMVSHHICSYLQTHQVVYINYVQMVCHLRWLSGKESACQCRRLRFDPWVRKIPWRRKWQPTPVFLPGKRHGQWSLEGYSPWGRKELDATEHSRVHLNKLFFLKKFRSQGNRND